MLIKIGSQISINFGSLEIFCLFRNWFQCWPIHYVIQSPISILLTIRISLITVLSLFNFFVILIILLLLSSLLLLLLYFFSFLFFSSYSSSCIIIIILFFFRTAPKQNISIFAFLLFAQRWYFKYCFAAVMFAFLCRRYARCRGGVQGHLFIRRKNHAVRGCLWMMSPHTWMGLTIIFHTLLAPILSIYIPFSFHATPP